MHLIMRHPDLFVVQYLLDTLNVEFDLGDYQDRTSFSIGIDYQITKQEHIIHPAVNLLMEKGANIDYPDEANQTPFLKLYNARLNTIAETLRAKGANINQMSKAGVFVLKIALIRRDNAEIERLHQFGANVNLKD